MALPLPKVLYDVQPGGGVATSMRGLNALSDDMLQNIINAAKAKYAPLTTMAKAASELAYSNLIAPQFMAKLMGNRAAVANMSEEQRQAALNFVHNAAQGKGTGANFLGNLPSTSRGLGFTNSVQGALDKLFNTADFSNMGGESNTSQSGNNLNVAPNQGVYEGDYGNPQYNNNAMVPGGTVPQLRQASEVTAPSSQQAGVPTQATNPLQSVPESTQVPQSKDQYFENEARAAGIVKEGEELGKIRAQAIGELDEQYQHALEASAPIDALIDISQKPEFIKTKNGIPFFQDKQLSVLEKIGSPEQQKMIGQFRTAANMALANTVNSFRGRILDKEITMANQIKISPNDTWYTMLGKLEAIKTFNEMTKQRLRSATKLMEKNHMNRGDALEEADKKMDASAIRKQVQAELNPKMIRIKDTDTGEILIIPEKRAQEFGVKNG